MKHIYIILVLLFCATVSRSQEKVYDSPTSILSNGKWSSFGDNYDALDKWIEKNKIYPKEAIDKQEQGKVEVGFIVEKDGSLSSIEIKKHVSSSLDAEVLRLARTMPKWNCAYYYGVPCRTRNSFTVNFKLPKTSTEVAKNKEQKIEWTNSSGQKIYEGEFELFGVKGKAKYQYRDAPQGTPLKKGGVLNGTRMFDGHFVFEGNGITATGDFEENRQIGTWHFGKKGVEKAIVNFNNNGELAGTFDFNWNDVIAKGEISKGQKKWSNIASNYISFIKVSITFSTPEGPFKIEAEGGYNFEDKCVGNWKMREISNSNFLNRHCNNNYNYEWTFAIYDDPGSLKNWYFIDSSTGDKSSMVNTRINDILKTVNNIIWNILSSFTFRQTMTLHN